MDAGSLPNSTQLGRYQVVKRLGGGATREVLLAVSYGPHGYERVVVLKRLLPTYETDDAMARMLASEAVAYARLTHPAIVRLYDFFETDGHPVLVLEYVDGLSLGQFLALLAARREPLRDPAALYIASRVFAALAAAHAARNPRTGEFAPVVHRDVSPGSVLLPWDGFVKLGDFGFAKVKGLGSDTSNTRPGHLKGTFGYMAPEQAMGEPVTPRTDVYAGCLLLRELLLGRPTFPDEMPELEFLRAMADLHLPPIETVRAGISPTLADAMRRGLARDPEGRTLTAAEMMRVLRQETDLGLAQIALVDALARVRPTDARPSTPPHGLRAITPASGTMRFERMHMPPEAMPSDVDTTRALDASDSYPVLGPDTHRPMVMLGPRSAPPAPSNPLFRRRRSPVLIAAAAAALASVLAFEVMLHEPAPGDAARPKLTSIVTATTGTIRPPPPVPSSSVVATAVAPARPPPGPAIAAPSPSPSAAPSTPSSAAAPPTRTTGDLLTPESARSHRVFVDGHYAAPRSGVTLRISCGKHVVRIGSAGREQHVDVPCGGEITVDAR